MKLTLQVWRQPSAREEGRFVKLEAGELTPEMSFLEMLDRVNERLIEQGQEPIAFDSDCREGICGSCGLVVDGYAHGKRPGSAVCQLHLRHFEDGAEVTVEPWRTAAFPPLKDLVTDRSALDRIVASGGFISVSTGGAPDGNATLIGKTRIEAALDAAACIGCGACVAACPNGSAALFTGAKLTHLAQLPQGQPERSTRALAMSAQADKEGFGNCSWHGECEVACPAQISIDTITFLNRDFLRATIKPPEGFRFLGGRLPRE